MNARIFGAAFGATADYFGMTKEKLPMPAVLVVDDEPLIRWSLSEGLVDAGYAVRQLATGAEVRQTLADWAGGPLVIVLDIRLPDVVDLSLLREIRLHYPQIPVLVMTAHGTADDAREATCLGVSRFVSKPFDVHAMVDMVGEALTSAYTSPL